MAILPKKNQDRKTAPAPRRRSAITTYRRSEPNDSQSPFSKKSPPRKIRRYLLGFLDIVFVIGILALAAYSLLVRPDPAIITNNRSYRNPAQYQTAAAAQLKHFDNRNKITFNQKRLADSLMAQFPEISGVSVELPLFSERPTLRLAVNGPSFFLVSQGYKYVITAGGRAVGTSSQLPQFKNLPTITDNSGFEVSKGAQVVSADSVGFINTVINECKRAKVPIASLTFPPVAQELDLRTTDQPYFVKFFMGGNVLTQTGQYLAARSHFDQTKQPPGQYLDVRVDGKIFFK
jgi:hypothetical protein